MKDSDLAIAKASEAVMEVEQEFRNRCELARADKPVKLDELSHMLVEYRRAHEALADAKFHQMMANIADTGVKYLP